MVEASEPRKRDHIPAGCGLHLSSRRGVLVAARSDRSLTTAKRTPSNSGSEKDIEAMLPAVGQTS